MTEPTDDELDAVIAEYQTRIYPQDMQPRFERAIMRAAIAKFGKPPAVAGEPWGACVSGRVFVGGLPDHVRKLAEAENLPIQWLYTTQQPTQPQADAITPPPIECNTEDLKKAYAFGWWSALEKQRETVQAGAVPLTDWDMRGQLAASLHCWHRLTPNEAAELVAFFKRIAAHGIKGGLHG